MKHLLATVGLIAVALTMSAGAKSAPSGPYWQFIGNWLCTSTNGSTVGYTFGLVSGSPWLSQSTTYVNGGNPGWVQNFVRQDASTHRWAGINFGSNGVTFQGDSAGFDKTGVLTLTGVEQTPRGDYSAREIYSFASGDGKMAHTWQVLFKEGWKTTSDTTCSRR